MGQRAITVYTPENADPHITADDDAFIYRVIFGADSGILGALVCVKVDDNTVRLSDGGAMNVGHILRIPDGETLELAVENGLAGSKRCDSVIIEFIKGGGNTADICHLCVVTGSPTSGTPQPPTLSTSNLRNQGDVNQVELFRLTLDGTTLTSVAQTATRFYGGAVSGGSSSSSSSSGNSSSSAGSSSSDISTEPTTKTNSGVLVSKVSSTVSSPTVHYSAAYSATKNGTALSVTLNFAAWLGSSGSTLGTGIKLTIYARLNGGSWKSVVIKDNNASWKGTAQHSAKLNLTATTSGSSATVEFYVTRTGSNYSGTAGTLGSDSAPKSYTINLS